MLVSFNSLTRMVLFWSCLMLSDADKEPVDTKTEAKEEGDWKGRNGAFSCHALSVWASCAGGH